MTTTNRRNFIKAATAAGGSILIAPQLSKANVVEQKLPKGEINIAFIGAGYRGKASKCERVS